MPFKVGTQVFMTCISLKVSFFSVLSVSLVSLFFNSFIY